MQKFDYSYFYIWLDPTRPGKFIYGTYSFSNEPFYVGKGIRGRYFDEKCRNKEIENRLKYLTEEKIKPIRLVFESETEEAAFNNETFFVDLIGRKDLGKGPLLNKRNGGKGGKLGQIPWNKGKHGLQIVWNKGKKNCFSEETLEQLSNSLRGRSVWNKGIRYKTKPCPEETKLKIAESHRETYKITFPIGKNKIINNLKEFCKLNDLTYANMCAVSRGLRNHHKGFKIEKISIP